VSKLLWVSPSKLKKYLACPAASRLPYSETAPMVAGTIRHRLLQAVYQGKLKLTDVEAILAAAAALPEWKRLPDDMKAGIAPDLYEAGKRKGFLPDPEHVLSVEGDAIPAKYLHRWTPKDSEEEKLLACVPVTESWGLRLISDLVVLPPDEPETLLGVDWKGYVEDEGDEIQAACTAIANARMFPGYQRYDFETRHIPTGKRVEYPFAAKELPEIEKWLDGQVKKMAADTVFPERLNRWCTSCELRDKCATYKASTSTPLAPTVQAAKQLPVDQPDAELVELYEQVKLTASVADARKEMLADQLKARLKVRPISHAGKDYTLGDKVTSYTLLQAAAAEFLPAIGIPPEDVTGIDAKKLEAAFKEILAGLEPDQAELWQAKYDALYVANTSKQIKTEPTGGKQKAAVKKAKKTKEATAA
jgi:hypothetical protein